MKVTPNDPLRPVILAVNAGRLLGVLLCGIAVLIAVFGNAPIALLIALAVFVTPGVLLIVFASCLKSRKPWAAIALIIVGSVVAVVSAIGVVTLAMARTGGVRNANTSGPLIFNLMVCLSAIMLIVHSARSIAVLRNLALQSYRPTGFEPVFAQPVAPPADQIPPVREETSGRIS